MRGMDQKITITRNTKERTSTGGLKKASSSVLFTDWAEIKRMRGTKRIEYTKLGYTDPKEVKISNRPGVDPETWPKECTAEIGGKEYQILSAFVTDDKMFIRMEVQK
jgi:hypothetical protein